MEFCWLFCATLQKKKKIKFPVAAYRENTKKYWIWQKLLAFQSKLKYKRKYFEQIQNKVSHNFPTVTKAIQDGVFICRENSTVFSNF